MLTQTATAPGANNNLSPDKALTPKIQNVYKVTTLGQKQTKHKHHHSEPFVDSPSQVKRQPKTPKPREHRATVTGEIYVQDDLASPHQALTEAGKGRNLFQGPDENLPSRHTRDHLNLVENWRNDDGRRGYTKDRPNHHQHFKSRKTSKKERTRGIKQLAM